MTLLPVLRSSMAERYKRKPAVSSEYSHTTPQIISSRIPKQISNPIVSSNIGQNAVEAISSSNAL
jgi:hypothetical protein